jgi:hypothetical protein
MKNKSYILFSFLLLLITGSSYGQQSLTISGKIIDSKTKEPIIGAAVSVKGSAGGANTNVSGAFSFKTTKKPPFTVVATFVGYRKQEIEVFENEPLTIKLVESKGQRLDEIIVVGYGTQKRSDITGSIASVPLEIKSQPVVSVERLLQGSIAGAIVTQTSGQPGGGVSVQIRGNNSITAGSDPLYVIDGFPINNDYSVADAGVTDGSKLTLYQL